MKESNKMELFWGLGKAQYLTVPRSVIQEMPVEWQDKLAELLNELDESCNWRPTGNLLYWVFLMTEGERAEFGNDIGYYDPLSNYRHGNSLAGELMGN